MYFPSVGMDVPLGIYLSAVKRNSALMKNFLDWSSGVSEPDYVARSGRPIYVPVRPKEMVRDEFKYSVEERIWPHMKRWRCSAVFGDCSNSYGRIGDLVSHMVEKHKVWCIIFHLLPHASCHYSAFFVHSMLFKHRWKLIQRLKRMTCGKMSRSL